MSAPLRWDVEGRDWPLRDSSRFVIAGGLDWHVQVLGAGPAILLLHGTGASTHSWRGVAPLLAERFTVVAPDLPGHGFTRGRPRGGLTMPAMAGAVAALLAALDIEPVLVVGHSAGVAIAARMALDGLAATPVVGFAPALLPFKGIAAPLFPALAKLLFVNPVAPRLFSRIARVSGETERFLLRSTGSRIDRRGLELYARLFASPSHCAGALEMMADWDLPSLARQLGDLRLPVLLTHGERDTAIPVAVAREAAARIPNAALELLPGRGHLAHEERPDLAAKIVIGFAADHAIPGAETAETMR